MILACLNGGEDGREAVDSAGRLAADLQLRLVVVRVLAEGDSGDSCGPGEWTLRTDSPVEPLSGFVRRNRVRHVVLGPRAWARWGEALLRARRSPFPNVLKP
ncbi:MAG: hypothetical protein FD126_1431 [Elusimicrobia bacterium]|nr:MAG: hypothetical protein FD126_1431 [Elusimicrobiota bacterium]